MSFFGGAASTPAKPGGMFSSFNAGTPTNINPPAASTTQAGFTGSAPTFGTPGFGGATTANTAQPNFSGGIAFGGFGSNAAPAGGTTFFGAAGAGTNAATTAAAAPTTFNNFGTAATSVAPTGFGGFGNAVTTSAAPAFGGFGGTQGTTFATGGTFGNAASTGAFGTGSAAGAFSAGATAGGFGTGAATGAFGAGSATGAFGTGSAPGSFGTAAATGGFGTGSNTGAFGSTFARPSNTTVTPGFGGFGGNTNFMLGQPQQAPPQLSQDEAFAQSILNVAIFGDERDNIIAKWNYLQGMWGTGKLFYSQSAPPVEITQQNHLCRFKAIGYSRLPGKDNKMGLVALNFSKPIEEVKTQQQQIVQTLNALFGNKPQLVVHIDDCKEIDDKKTQMVIYIEEKSQFVQNESKRILATEVSIFLNQPHIRAQLNNLSVIEVLALVIPDDDQLREYLDNSPKGIDPRMWRQAILDNPNPAELIPVPMIGFHDLKWRVTCLEEHSETHSLYLKRVEKELTELRQRHAAATAKIMEHKRQLAELSHNILRIIVRQESTRKVGLALTPDEEALRTKLENMLAVVSAPTQFKGRVSELLSQIRMQGNQFSNSANSEYTIDKEREDEIKSFLTMQQKAMDVLADCMTKDMKSLEIIKQGLPDLKRML